MIRTLHEGLLADGISVPLTKLCAWFGVPRRTVYYKPTKAAPKVDPRFAEPIKAMIEKEPSFGYRTVAWLLGFNKNTVQRIFQIKGWQVRKRPIGMRPRIEAVPSVATAPNERWSTDLCRVWAGRDGWTTLALVIDCYSRELLGWHLSRSGKASTAASALEHALISRFGILEGAAGVPAEIRQRPRLHISALYGAGPQLRAEAGVHHAALPATERHGRARHPDAEGAIHPPPALRQHPARHTRDRGLDQPLQQPAPASGARDEDTGCCGTSGIT